MGKKTSFSNSKSSIQGLGHGLSGRVLAEQARGLEFTPKKE
jgi:hypothetical protein